MFCAKLSRLLPPDLLLEAAFRLDSTGSYVLLRMAKMMMLASTTVTQTTTSSAICNADAKSLASHAEYHVVMSFPTKTTKKRMHSMSPTNCTRKFV